MDTVLSAEGILKLVLFRSELLSRTHSRLPVNCVAHAFGVHRLKKHRLKIKQKHGVPAILPMLAETARRKRKDIPRCFPCKTGLRRAAQRVVEFRIEKLEVRITKSRKKRRIF
jgi:hypothetical protein